MKLKFKDKATIKGKLRFTTYKAENWFGRLLVWLKLKERKMLRQTGWMKNLVVLNSTGNGHGMNLLVKRLINNTTNDLIITQAKIGDDDTAPVNGDTDLGNPLVSGIVVATATETAVNIATFEFFISDAELPEDDYKEFGIFCGNQLFARSIISPTYTKSIGEDSKIEYKITVNNT
ncbi:MAG: hypothetical protein ACKKMS_00165 [Candidatus Nealsonbacteria bacterium]